MRTDVMEMVAIILDKMSASITPSLDEYSAAIEQARVELHRLRPLAEAAEDESFSACLEEVDLSLQMIASDMRTRMQRVNWHEWLAGLRGQVIGRARAMTNSVIARVLGGVPWF